MLGSLGGKSPYCGLTPKSPYVDGMAMSGFATPHDLQRLALFENFSVASPCAAVAACDLGAVPPLPMSPAPKAPAPTCVDSESGGESFVESRARMLLVRHGLGSSTPPPSMRTLSCRAALRSDQGAAAGIDMEQPLWQSSCTVESSPSPSSDECTSFAASGVASSGARPARPLQQRGSPTSTPSATKVSGGRGTRGGAGARAAKRAAAAAGGSSAASSSSERR
jgi:hypothetical protein